MGRLVREIGILELFLLEIAVFLYIVLVCRRVPGKSQFLTSRKGEVRMR